MNREATRDRILDAAERLFALRGIRETSLRVITAEAGANLASVNYHFGDKKTLVRAVLNRYLEAFMPAVQDALVNLNLNSSYEMAEVLLLIAALVAVPASNSSPKAVPNPFGSDFGRAHGTTTAPRQG